MGKNFIAKQYQDAESTLMGQSGDKALAYDDLINLSIGDPDFITNDIIIDGAFHDAKAGHTKYTAFSGDPELKEAIAELYSEEYNIKLKDKQIFVTASGCMAMCLALMAVIDDGDEVIVHAPHFTPYMGQIKIARGVPVILNTYEDEGFDINLDRLEALIRPKTKALILNTPCNPTGACFSKETLLGIARLANKHDILVIADDIYDRYSYKKEFLPIMSIDGMLKRCITINSFSKNYIMTGWRIGNIIAPEEIIKTIQMINENMVFTAPSISQRAGIYAIKNRHIIQPPIIEEYKERMSYAAKRINNIDGMSVLAPQGTFYLFVSIKGTGLSSVQAADAILEQAHVLTIPGNAFGDCGEGYLRLSVTVGLDKIDEAMNRIEKVVWRGK